MFSKFTIFSMGSAQEKTVEHLGRVVEVTRNSVRVTIESKSACGTCQSKSACSISESTEKDIVVENRGQQFHVGDQVKVVLQRSQAMRAVVLGYIFPLFILLGVLISCAEILNSEVKAGLWAIGSVGIYYLMLHVFRKRVGEKFEFKVERID